MEHSFWGTFVVSGRVFDAETKKARADLAVEAWDGSELHDDYLGEGTTDSKGRFTISVDKSSLRDLPKDYRPEVYFKVFDGEDFLFSTESAPVEDPSNCLIALLHKPSARPYRCRPRNIYLKIEKILGYSPVDPDPDAHGMYRKDCMYNEGHENGLIPDPEVSQRTLDAVIYREYLDAAYTIPRTTKMVPADLTEPSWYRRVPGPVLYLRPGRRVRIHVLNGDDRPHSLHVHGLAYGVDSDGSFPFGVRQNSARRRPRKTPADSSISPSR